MRYSVVIHKDPGSDYGVTVPDLPGCFSAGETPEDALAQAAEAIECHIEGLLLDGDPIPEAKNIRVHQGNPDYAEGEWKSVVIDLKNLTDSVQAGNSSNFFRQLISSLSTPRLLPYAAGLLVLIGGLYLGIRYFEADLLREKMRPDMAELEKDSPVNPDLPTRSQFSKLTPVSPAKVEPTLVRGQSKDVRVPPSDFGAFPKIPEGFPDQDIWDVVEKRAVDDPDGAKTLELLARVRIKLWEQGKRTKGVIMDPSTGLIYSDSGIKIFPDLRMSTSVDSNSKQSQYDAYFDDGFIPQGRISVEFVEGGIDPYEFLNLPR